MGEKAIPVVGEFRRKQRSKPATAEIVSFDGRQMISWERISIAMVDVIGDKTTVQVGLRPLDSSVVNKVTIPVPKELITDASPLVAFGIKPWSPPIEAKLGRIVTGGVAEAAGLWLVIK